MEFLGWWAAIVLLVLLLAREWVWRRRMHAVIGGVRALQRELAATMGHGSLMRPWTPPGQVSGDSRTTVRSAEPPPPPK